MAGSRVPTDRKRLREALFVPPYHKRQLTNYQLEWLKDHFHDKENSKLSSALNISLSTLHRFARELELTKSEAGMRAIKKRQAAQIKKVCEENGYFEVKLPALLLWKLHADYVRRALILLHV